MFFLFLIVVSTTCNSIQIQNIVLQNCSKIVIIIIIIIIIITGKQNVRKNTIQCSCSSAHILFQLCFWLFSQKCTMCAVRRQCGKCLDKNECSTPGGSLNYVFNIKICKNQLYIYIYIYILSDHRQLGGSKYIVMWLRSIFC